MSPKRLFAPVHGNTRRLNQQLGTLQVLDGMNCGEGGSQPGWVNLLLRWAPLVSSMGFRDAILNGFKTITRCEGAPGSHAVTFQDDVGVEQDRAVVLRHDALQVGRMVETML